MSACLAHAVIGLVLVGLGIPLMLEKVPPNTWYGFRIRATLKDAKVWYPANAWAGRRLIVLGVASVVGAGVGILIPEHLRQGYGLALAVLLIIGSLLILVFGVRYARSLADR